MSGINHMAQINMNVAPTESNHVVRLQDMQDYVAGKVKTPVRLVSTENVEATYSGTPNFTLTSTESTPFSIDGVEIAAQDRILLAGQTDKKQNGIYVATTVESGNIVFTRAEDFRDADNIFDGVRVAVREGTKSADTLWVMTTNDPVTLDSSDLNWSEQTTGSKDQPGSRQKVFTITGDDSTKEWTFNHNFNTKNVTVEVFADESGATTLFDVTRTDENNIKVSADVAIATGVTYSVICRG